MLNVLEVASRTKEPVMRYCMDYDYASIEERLMAVTSNDERDDEQVCSNTQVSREVPKLP